MTSPRGLAWAEGQPQRPSRAVLASWQGLQAGAQLRSSQNSAWSPRCGTTWSTTVAGTTRPWARQAAQSGCRARKAARARRQRAHSLCVLRSAADGPAPASPLPRCAPRPDGARAASRATATPQSKTRRGSPGRASRDSYRLWSPKLHLAVNDINPARDGGTVNRLGQPGYRASRPGCPAHDPAVADGHSSADAAPNPEGCVHSRSRAKHSPPGSRPA